MPERVMAFTIHIVLVPDADSTDKDVADHLLQAVCDVPNKHVYRAQVIGTNVREALDWEPSEKRCSF